MDKNKLGYVCLGCTSIIANHTKINVLNDFFHLFCPINMFESGLNVENHYIFHCINPAIELKHLKFTFLAEHIFLLNKNSI